MQKQLTLAELVELIRGHDGSIDDLVERYGEHEIKIEELAAIVKALQSVDAPNKKARPARPSKKAVMLQEIADVKQLIEQGVTPLEQVTENSVCGMAQRYDDRIIILGSAVCESVQDAGTAGYSFKKLLGLQAETRKELRVHADMLQAYAVFNLYIIYFNKAPINAMVVPKQDVRRNHYELNARSGSIISNFGIVSLRLKELTDKYLGTSLPYGASMSLTTECELQAGSNGAGGHYLITLNR